MPIMLTPWSVTWPRPWGSPLDLDLYGSGYGPVGKAGLSAHADALTDSAGVPHAAQAWAVGLVFNSVTVTFTRAGTNVPGPRISLEVDDTDWNTLGYVDWFDYAPGSHTITIPLIPSPTGADLGWFSLSNGDFAYYSTIDVTVTDLYATAATVPLFWTDYAGCAEST